MGHYFLDTQYIPCRLVNMAPLVAADGQVLANGELDEYLQRNLDKAKVRPRFCSEVQFTSLGRYFLVYGIQISLRPLKKNSIDFNKEEKNG